jgi:hypothetical protein
MTRTEAVRAGDGNRPAPAAKALDGQPPRWRDAGQVMSELWRASAP